MSTRITDKLWGKVPAVKSPAPKGWLTIAEFAERAGGMNVQQIYKGIESGKISHKHLSILESSGDQRMVLINWDAAAYSFVIARRPAFRPDDFEVNEMREYKPFATTPQQETARDAEDARRALVESGAVGVNLPAGQNQNIVDERLVNVAMDVPKADDITSTKHIELLQKVAKNSFELLVAANDLIDMDTERSMLASIGAQLNGNASKSIPKWSDVFAAEDNPRVIRQLMKQLYVEVFKPMEGEDDN